jgi:4'-phosphopantetheinyl transferase EntD
MLDSAKSGATGVPRVFFRSILPDFAKVAEAPLGTACEELLPEEQAAAVTFAPRRLAEFQLGRSLARQALRELGYDDAVLIAGPDRAPRWPDGVVGSITHTGHAPDGYCAAAVARTADARAVGIDVERCSPLSAGLWQRVLTANEIAELEQRPPELSAIHAKLVFSAKETVYKCQYTLSRSWLGFHDVEIEYVPDSATFRCTFLKSVPNVAKAGDVMTGHCTIEGGLIFTAASIR